MSFLPIPWTLWRNTFTPDIRSATLKSDKKDILLEGIAPALRVLDPFTITDYDEVQRQYELRKRPEGPAHAKEEDTSQLVPAVAVFPQHLPVKFSQLMSVNRTAPEVLVKESDDKGINRLIEDRVQREFNAKYEAAITELWPKIKEEINKTNRHRKDKVESLEKQLEIVQDQLDALRNDVGCTHKERRREALMTYYTKHICAGLTTQNAPYKLVKSTNFNSYSVMEFERGSHDDGCRQRDAEIVFLFNKPVTSLSDVKSAMILAAHGKKNYRDEKNRNNSFYDVKFTVYRGSDRMVMPRTFYGPIDLAKAIDKFVDILEKFEDFPDDGLISVAISYYKSHY